jgi:hypothetical protein
MHSHPFRGSTSRQIGYAKNKGRKFCLYRAMPFQSIDCFYQMCIGEMLYNYFFRFYYGVFRI